VGLPLGYSLGLTSFWGRQYGAQGFWIGLIAGLGVASVSLALRFLTISRQHIKIQQP
jgi:MATE family multidrug resistance protein